MSELQNELLDTENNVEEEELEDVVDTEENDYDDSDEDNYSNASSDEFETIDVTENPMFHILSAFLEDNEGNNIVDRLTELTSAVREQTAMMAQTNSALLELLKTNQKVSRTNRKKE